MRCLSSLLVAVHALAAETVVTFDPPKTTVHWTLGTVLHTVHGSFQLKSGTIQFDPATGKATGHLIVSALSGESGNESRDKRMHSAILESVRFPEVVFTADKVVGKVAFAGRSSIQVFGNFQLHGQGHEFILPVELDMSDGWATTTCKFSVPYIKWGLKNASTFVLRTNDTVDIEIQATARVTNAN